ncbi:Uncharacterised protein [BD1-7 clade bacterium]|uniref:Glycine-rich domain-containing protein-like n=1 Tax=BD1-7 clade bacterium TaxID=2029982 RepID=A0A5S9QVR1_9GAMM|nr:Uncharacterised protein [BD1-7 clade bacterium]
MKQPIQPQVVAPITLALYNLEPNVAVLNFDRLKFKYCQSSESSMSEEQWDMAELEYRRYLSLKCFYPDVSLVPSKAVDELWHAHILDTQAYARDCQQVFGYFLHHFPYFGIHGKEDYNKLVTAFGETIALYEQHFGPYPKAWKQEAARCEDHACHAPSACACRSPGACK